MKETVNAVAFQDDGIWIAQCLEHDIVATAPSIAQLRTAFEKAVVSNLCVNTELGRNGLEGIPPAPDRFKELFESSQFGLRVEHIPPAEHGAVRIGDLRLADAA